VAEATRLRVREAAVAMGYRPNPVARRLSRGGTGMVALVMPAAPGQLYEPLFVELAAAIGLHLADHHLDLIGGGLDRAGGDGVVALDLGEIIGQDGRREERSSKSQHGFTSAAPLRPGLRRIKAPIAPRLT
jgi:hypothetical protein